jgi:hypothetical protein
VSPLLPNTLWGASCLPSVIAFQRSTRHVAATQRRILHRITGCRGVSEFRDRFALSDDPQEPVGPVLRRVPTSGTTGPTKRIPYTRELLAEFQRGIAPWVADLFRHNPSLLAGKSYWAISPVAGEADGFDDDTDYLGRAGRFARAALAVSPAVRHLRDMPAWRLETRRQLLACRELAFISVWHPSFLTLLLEDVEDPARYWPRLRVISCWADATAAEPARQLGRLFPQATIQPKGLIATEGFVTVPLWDRDGAALAIRSHFFEFLDDDDKPWLAHELATGREYSVVLTTGGGLRRYRLRDRVRVTGWEQECPLMRFVGKESLVSDQFGEKVSERQIWSALEGLAAGFVMVACEGNAYTLYVEAGPSPDVALRDWGDKLERALLQNVHYRYCRQLGQLNPVRVIRVGQGCHERYLAAQHARGRPLGAIKPALLAAAGDWSRVFGGSTILECNGTRMSYSAGIS